MCAYSTVCSQVSNYMSTFCNKGEIGKCVNYKFKAEEGNESWWSR